MTFAVPTLKPGPDTVGAVVAVLIAIDELFAAVVRVKSTWNALLPRSLTVTVTAALSPAVASIPAGTAAANPFTGTDGWYINPNSKNQAAAVDVALYIFGKEGLAAYADTATGPGDPPARTDVTMSDPLVKAFADAASGGFPRPQSAEFGNFWGPFGDAVTASVEGQAKPADAVATACQKMNQANKK